MAETKSVTFFPGSQVLYSGNFEDINDIGSDSQYIAKYERQNFTPTINGVKLSTSDAEYVANARGTKPFYKLDRLRDQLDAMARAKKKFYEFKKQSLGKEQFDASTNRKLVQLYEEYKKYSADLNSDNTHQLTIVQFVNRIIGNLEQPSYITAAFGNIPLDKLRGKIPEMGWSPVNVQVQRLSEPVLDWTEFGQSEFRIFRNDIHILTSREDRMEATIDPHAVSIQQGNIQMQRARELLALKELSNLTLNGTYGTLPDITATTTQPRDTNDAPAAFVSVMLQHFNTYYNYLKYFIFNPLDYRAYLANWFTHAYTKIEEPEGFGVVPFYGLEKYGAIAILSPYVPRTICYALCKEGAYELDGPYIVDSEYEAKKFADYNIVHDFIGYKIINPTRFGEKLSLPQSGVSAGTEITTNKNVYDLLAPPASLVVKNASA